MIENILNNLILHSTRYQMGNTCIQRDKLSNIDSLQVSIEIKNN